MAIGDEKQTQAGRAALACLARGWSVIPVKAFAKRPIVRWEPFQNRLPTREEVDGWFRRWSDANNQECNPSSRKTASRARAVHT